MAIDAQAALASATSALQTVAAAVGEKDATLSALSLQVDSLSEANIALQAQLDAANATITDLKAALEAAKPAPKTVLDYGAKGDGLTLCNGAFAKAAADGAILVPAGRYVIDPLSPIVLGDGCQVTFDPDAVIVTKANASPRYYLFRVTGNDVKVRGGLLLGDRDLHDYSSGGTHEWGYGVLVSGARCTIEGTVLDGFTGDGVGVSGDYCTLLNVTSRRNRRQGLSVFDCKGLRAKGCTFSDTNGAQNGPCAGVDFEPDNGSVADAILEDCKSINNRMGYTGWIGSGNPGASLDVTFINCDTDNNANGFEGKAVPADARINFKIQGGRHNNRSAGAAVKDHCHMDIAGCTFSFVGKTRTEREAEGIVTKYDIQVGVGGSATVGMNKYV